MNRRYNLIRLDYDKDDKNSKPEIYRNKQTRTTEGELTGVYSWSGHDHKETNNKSEN